MTDVNRISGEAWALQRAMLLGAICLVVGITAGWLIRGWEGPGAAASTSAAAPVASAPRTASGTPAAVSPTNAVRLKQQADSEAQPLLEQLKSQPDNADLLTSLGNLYYDAQQYPAAIEYYQRALKSRPNDASVRTDMGTAYWYMGNADAAIGEFDQALINAPTSPNTLFNRGLVKWQGKGDSAGAIADWNKLLATNPNYEGKDKVQQMLGEVEKHAAAR